MLTFTTSIRLHTNPKLVAFAELNTCLNGEVIQTVRGIKIFLNNAGEINPEFPSTGTYKNKQGYNRKSYAVTFSKKYYQEAMETIIQDVKKALKKDSVAEAI